MTAPQRGTSQRGFASMDQDKQRAIAAKGGRAAHASGNAHEFSPAEARVAGRKGGQAISRDRQHMAAIGREGGHARHAGTRQQQQRTDEPQAERPPRQQG
ncbi:TPA: KGG domain-containing protein [Stenotrophomonas maltophilia]